LLDLFCGAGGASMGYYRAGFDVVGVDIVPQPNYPFEFIQADAIEYGLDHAFGFDAAHFSPPCQFATAYRRRKGVAVDAVNLIEPARGVAYLAGVPYVIENVEQAREHLIDPVRFCGGSTPWRLDVRRHRLFESNLSLSAPPCDHSWQTPRFPCATNRTNLRRTVEIGVRRIKLDVQQRAMGIDWMTREELSQAIPPAYTEHIGRQLIDALSRQEAA
jgi:DNA (cytosine-5)-methyltransferase 1